MTYEALHKHLEETGRLKLLPRILRELKRDEERKRELKGRKETAKENPSLISGWRFIENGILTDRTAKSALIEIYQKITAQ
jgi:hypothetical protein